MRRGDFLFLIVCVVLIGAAIVLFRFVSKDTGRKVVIEEGSEVFGSYPLSDDKTIEVTGILGISTVVIKDGEVYMKESPCPNKVCLHMGKISEVNETIVCIPNRIYITVK